MRTYISKIQMKKMRNEEEAVTYIGLKIMYDKMLTVDKEIVEANFNVSNLYYEISGSCDMTRTDRNKLEKGINGLLDLGIVKELARDDRGTHVLDITGLKIVDNEPYTTMSREEVRTIFNLPCKQHFSLLRFADGLFGTFNSEYKCGWAAFRSMPEITGLSCSKTCQAYFKLLEDNGVIYVRRCGTVKTDDEGNVKTISNVYGRPEDKEAIDAYYLDRCCQEGYKFGKKDKEDEAAETAQEAVEAPQEPQDSSVTASATQHTDDVETPETGSFCSDIAPIDILSKKKTEWRHGQFVHHRDFSATESDADREARRKLNDEMKESYARAMEMIAERRANRAKNEAVKNDTQTSALSMSV